MNSPWQAGASRRALCVLLTLVAAAPATASVPLVDGGRLLRQIVDSGVPLDPSQTALDTACEFSGSIPANVESIAVRPSDGTLWVQIVAGGGGSGAGVDSCVFAISSAGVVTPVSLSTGLAVNDRGADLVYDPTTGLLLTMDDPSGVEGSDVELGGDSEAARTGGRYTDSPDSATSSDRVSVAQRGVGGPALPPGRIVSINPVNGVVATYSQLTDPAFGPGGTFGMQFSAGVGDVPAGQVVYTTDVNANGIYSTSAGSTNGPAYVVPPVPGDDMSIQPDGDWVHIGDNGQIIAYSPFAPYTASPSGLAVSDLLVAESLNDTFGTRSTVCSTTGDLYVTQSGEGGGAGIFRIDETLTTATLIVRVDGDEGLHDLVVGPASSGVGTSLYFTVWDYLANTQEVWEVTTPECGAVSSITIPTLSPAAIALMSVLLLFAGSVIVLRMRSA